jgi:hypothetical protein
MLEPLRTCPVGSNQEIFCPRKVESYMRSISQKLKIGKSVGLMAWNSNFRHISPFVPLDRFLNDGKLLQLYPLHTTDDQTELFVSILIGPSN